ncbi:MAG: helix-turn-helix transcriptional regulator, partial [Pseudomonadota bacterium]
MPARITPQGTSEKTKQTKSAVSNFVFSDKENEMVAKRIREVIGDQFVSAFARKCGISEAVIRTYINDGRMPPLNKAASIASAGGVTVDWLATGREPKYRRDVVAAASAEPAPDQASGEPVDLVAIYKDAPPEGRRALAALAVA